MSNEALHSGFRNFDVTPPPRPVTRCDVCEKDFYDGVQYVDHLKSHIASQVGLFSCSSCNGSCVNPDHLKATFAACLARNTTIPNFEHHLKQKGEENARLGTSSKSSGRPSSPTKSKNRPRPFACDVCHKTFTKDLYLAQHARIHTGERPFTCDVCNKSFSQSGHLVSHRRVHTADRPFFCDVCNKGFAHSRNLVRHRRSHEGVRPYSCDLCGKSFLQAEHMNNHKRRVHDGQKFDCLVCGKSFNHSFNLERHMRIHTGERPYQCTHCEKSFNQSTHLANHMKCHADVEKCGDSGRKKELKNDKDSSASDSQPEPEALQSVYFASPKDQRERPADVASGCVFPPGFPWYRASSS